MRYDDWDIILFPRESHTPLQEFRTACYTSVDEYGGHLPILTCFVASLPPSTPFRLSLHSWSSPAKISALIESQRKADQKVVFGVKVCVDRVQAFHGLFDPSSKWPQEIADETAADGTTEQSSDRPKLEFPDFSQRILLQPSWDARDATRKITITLSEQVVNGTGPLEKAELGVSNDIVCYSFQHAPKDVLEQAGISWPIRNPLYLAHTFGQLRPASQKDSLLSTARHASLPTKDAQLIVPGLRAPSLTVHRTGSPEPHARAHLRPRPHTRVPRAHTLPGSNVLSLPEDESQPTLSELDVDPTKFATFQHQNSSSSQLPGTVISHNLHPTPPWLHNGLATLDSTFPYEPQLEVNWSEKGGKMFGDSLTGVTSRSAAHAKDGLSMGSMLPKLHASSSNFDGAPEICMVRPSTSHGYYSPSLMNAPQMHRTYSNSTLDTSAASQTKNLFRNSNRSFTSIRAEQGSLKPPVMYYTTNQPNKENRPSSQPRGPTSIPQSNRVPNRSDSASTLGIPSAGNDTIDPSLAYWNLPALELMPGMDAVPYVPRVSHAHAPSTTGFVRGRKEYKDNGDSATLKDVSGRRKRNGATQVEITTRPVEIIDLDGIDTNIGIGAPDGNTKQSPPKPGHKSGTSSIDSTARLERTLFSALGDELNHLNRQLDTTDMGHELAQALGVSKSTDELEPPIVRGQSSSDEDPAVKRKRQGTIGGERDRSPMKKKERGQDQEALQAGNDILVLRGD